MSTPYDSASLIRESLDQEPGPEALAMASKLAARRGVLAILFYGNRLRDVGAEGLLDFYVLTERDSAYHGWGVSALANRLLPPNVYFEELDQPDPEQEAVSAKVGVMRLDAFRNRMRTDTVDTTLWARFSQPSRLIYARDDATRAAVLEAIEAAYLTASQWAVRLAGPGASAQDAWEGLYSQTYGAELRVEGAGRVSQIYKGAEPIYIALHASQSETTSLGEDETLRARRSWARRRVAGKALNLVRLIKAAFTFRGGLAYGLSKIERHSGEPVVLSPLARRVPWLAAPFVLLCLLWQRRLR